MNTFATWDDVLEYVTHREWIWYQAPMDRRPRSAKIVKVFKSGKVRLDPCMPDADAFTAGPSHFDRFRRHA